MPWVAAGVRVAFGAMSGKGNGLSGRSNNGSDLGPNCCAVDVRMLSDWIEMLGCISDGTIVLFSIARRIVPLE